MNNMQQILKQAQKLQEKLEKAQKELGEKEVTGASGAGLVGVVMALNGIVKSVKIDKTIINPDESEILEDLVTAAYNDAKNKADKMIAEEMNAASGGMDLSQLRGLI
jgi:DNA-binding YbaB/EbfC family protein